MLDCNYSGLLVYEYLNSSSSSLFQADLHTPASDLSTSTLVLDKSPKFATVCRKRQMWPYHIVINMPPHPQDTRHVQENKPTLACDY
jgi:hypothetical protein